MLSTFKLVQIPTSNVPCITELKQGSARYCKTSTLFVSSCSELINVETEQ